MAKTTQRLQTARLIGGAGTGKTTHLMDVLGKVVGELHDPRLVGFVSFTRAARAEAAKRAADQFGMRPADLEVGGWFRTLHSVCYKALNVGDELLTGSAESRRWLQEAIQDDASPPAISADGEPLEVFDTADTDAEKALGLWQAARNRMAPFAEVWAVASSCDSHTPDYDYCTEIIERYEQCKRIDHRCDFVDILSRFAGVKSTLDGAEEGEPEGELPELPAWFFDEQQDTSKLLDAVCRRLVSTDETRWVYLAGDPFQSIYTWAGADHRCFMDWPADKTRVMGKSWRCPAPILDAGESILRLCSDYWDRGIAPADHDGYVEARRFDELIEIATPEEPWLILARTNYQAQRIAGVLSVAGVPWTPTGGRGGWNAPIRNEACKALMALEVGAPISGDQWQHVLKSLPSTANGEQLLARGTKSLFARMEPDEAQDKYPWVRVCDWVALGIMPPLHSLLIEGAWHSLVKGAREYTRAVGRWGAEVVDDPMIKVGTIHSVKGEEADNVALLSTISKPIAAATKTTEGRDAEQRVWYVGATRARRRLVVLNEENPRYRKGIL